ncbi:MAG: helix-turn-helix domain-containing protein [Muribaculaceae bacterium]|nr:helix-turn-helix domain-containing protein [Muribaculaceae bacterium]
MENLFDKLEEPSPSATPLERLHYLIKLSRLNQAQFAKRLQMDPGALSRILSGKTAISRRFIDRLVLDLGISREWIMSGNDVPYPKEMVEKKRHSPGAPVYDIDVAAGTTPLSRMFTEEHIIGRVNLPGIDPELPIVRVSGNSMQPRLNPGSLISIRPMDLDSTIRWGQIYVVVLPDFRVVKSLRKGPTPETVILHSANPDYEDIEIERKDIEALFLVENVICYDFLA